MKPAGLLDIKLPSVELVDRHTDPAALTKIQKGMIKTKSE
jgi:hypothetical protein